MLNNRYKLYNFDLFLYFCKAKQKSVLKLQGMETDKHLVIGQLIKTARHLKRLSMDDLCHLLCNCVTKQTISNYERGKYIPSASFLNLIQTKLNLPPYYFCEPQSQLTQIELRTKGIYTAKELSSLQAHIQTKLSKYIHLETILGLTSTYANPLEKITVHNCQDIEDAATLLRDKWKLGNNSIPYLCHQLEYRGIRIIEISNTTVSFDGMSGMITPQNQPFIAINKDVTPERLRFTVAHELGHLVLNIGDEIDNKEKACNYFAGSLLFPVSAIVYELGQYRKAVSLEEMVSIKERYGMSIAAIVHRAHDLDIINRTYYDHLYDDVINKNRMEIGWGNYKIQDVPRRYDQLQSRAISENIVQEDAQGLTQSEVQKVKITIL